MRAVVIPQYALGYDHVTTVSDHPEPTPKAGEVVVKIAASPINPSDLSFVQGMYGIRKTPPVVGGFEASGVISAVGEGVDPSRIGQRVACFAGDGDGTWAEYVATSQYAALPVPEAASLEQASMMLVNPLTAWALIEKARAAGVSAIVQTAAGSALGGMIRRLAGRYNIAVIDIVRRDEQVTALQSEGAAYVLNSSADGFDSLLRERCRSLNALLAFDAVGGDLTDRVLRAMPNGATITVYGGLAAAPVTIGVDQLIFRDKKVDGFWLSRWLPSAGQQVMAAWLDVSAGIGAEYHSEIRARYRLEDAAQVLSDYAAQMSGGKVLFVP